MLVPGVWKTLSEGTKHGFHCTVEALAGSIRLRMIRTSADLAYSEIVQKDLH